jgi:hypothetical protein
MERWMSFGRNDEEAVDEAAGQTEADGIHLENKTKYGAIDFVASDATQNASNNAANGKSNNAAKLYSPAGFELTIFWFKIFKSKNTYLKSAAFQKVLDI